MASNHHAILIMSDAQKAAASLNLLVETCTIALSALNEDAADIADYPTADISVLRTDFISLLSILYAATTKVALSLKPSDPHHKASLVPLKDLTNNVPALIHSVRLIRRQEGFTIAKEYEGTTRDAVTAIRSLTQTLLSSSSNSTASEEYLMKAGGVHEIIEAARKPGVLSTNNREAVRKLWERDHGSLVDGFEEIKEICEPTEDDDEDDEDFFDDGWAELGASSKQKLSLRELQRAGKVRAIAKLGVLLHKRIIGDTLSSTSLNDNPILDKLGGLSDKLLAASDDLISSMYAPQQLPSVKLYLDSYNSVVKDIRSIVAPHATLEGQLGALSLASNSDPVLEKTRKWFTTCFDQMDKAVVNCLADLDSED